MKKQKRIVSALLAAALCLVLAFGCAPAAAPEAPAAASEAPAAAAPEAQTEAPAAEAQPAQEESAPEAAAPGGAYDGVTFTTSDLTGRKITETYIRDNKVTVVNFWATWCPPCVAEIPDFSEVAAEYANKGCAFLGVQLDEDVEAAKALWDKHGVTYPTVLPDGDLAALANTMQYVPDTVLFNSDGKQIGEIHIGGLSKGELTELIDSALAAG